MPNARQPVRGKKCRRPMTIRGMVFLAGIACGFGAMSTAWADDVTDQINEALKAYAKKDFTTATTALEAASNLIRQMRAEAWTAVLPDALPGWTASDPENSTLGQAMFGGGTSVSRKYGRGDDTVDISLITDSPMLQGLGALLGAGLLTGTDNKLVIIDGRKVTYTKSDNSYQTMVAGKVLVKVEGSKGVDDQTLRAYLKAIKFDSIEKPGP
jgi:hypothetical protein